MPKNDDKLEQALQDEQNQKNGENTDDKENTPTPEEEEENKGGEQGGQDDDTKENGDDDGKNEDDSEEEDDDGKDEDDEDKTPKNTENTDKTNDSDDPLDQVSDQLSTDEKKQDSAKSDKNGIIELHNTDIEYNERGEAKLQPLEVAEYLAMYDDFSNVRGYEKTRYQMEFEKLVKSDRVIDMKTTKELLRRQGHEV